MVCCAAVLLIVGFLRRLTPGARRRVLRQPDFAPMAFRPIPGTTRLPPPSAAAAEVPRQATRAVMVARAAAAGAVVYLLASAALAVTGLADSTASPTSWIARTAVIMACVFAVLTGTDPHSAAPRERTGCGLVGLGLAWTELGEIDAHLLGLFDLTTTAGHVAFHGAGIAALTVGVVVLTRTSKENDHGQDVRGHADGDRVERGGPGDPAVPAGSGLAAAGHL